MMKLYIFALINFNNKKTKTEKGDYPDMGYLSFALRGVRAKAQQKEKGKNFLGPGHFSLFPNNR